MVSSITAKFSIYYKEKENVIKPSLTPFTLKMIV